MFFSFIVLLPSFGIENKSERENLIKELLEVNGGEDFQEEGRNQEIIVQSEGKISGNGEFIERKKKLGDAKLNNKNHLNYYF